MTTTNDPGFPPAGLKPIEHVYDLCDVDKAMRADGREDLIVSLHRWGHEHDADARVFLTVFLGGDDAAEQWGGFPAEVAAWWREKLPGVKRVMLVWRW